MIVYAEDMYAQKLLYTKSCVRYILHANSQYPDDQPLHDGPKATWQSLDSLCGLKASMVTIYCPERIFSSSSLHTV